MTDNPGRRRRRGVIAGVAGLTAVILVLSGCSSSAGTSPGGGETGPAGAPAGPAPGAAPAIMNGPAYRAAHWTYQVSDLDSGEVLLADRPDEFVFTASTAKLFTVGTAYETLGADARLTTPVYAIGRVEQGVLQGDLALVASGDLTMGGRNAAQGRADSTFTATTVDHVYGDIAPNAVAPPGDPLAGLDSLAAQVAATGIHRISGDVLVDDRLWQPFGGQEGSVPPIFVNDNLLDLTVTPTTSGQPATVSASPRTSAYQVISEVRTEAGADSELQVSADPRDPHRLTVTGSIGTTAGPRLTVYRVPDASTWARTLFMEALARAGVTVTADPLAADGSAALPAEGSYAPAQQVATLRSPPISAFGTMILKTSYNTGANALMCRLAVHTGSTDCLDGLKPMRALITTAGLVADDVVLVDGQGADPASVTPAQMVTWLRWTQTRPWKDAFKAGQPVLGESGSLASSGGDSPARGKVAAKTGTSAHPDPGTGRALFNVQRLAGFMTGPDGRTLVFDLAVSGGTYPDVLTGLVQAGKDVAAVAAEFQQELSR
jgi:D-alanyl-D-alanine carboxypeptidase/D-alanyl-D-alanine-endopeptidase (penicillin-binding protein 4)